MTASVVRSRPRAIHGWRPNSVTNQPASIAITDSGPLSAMPVSSRRGTARLRSVTTGHANAISSISVALPTIASNE